ncbi:MAG: hypothetical protein LBI30_00185 [Holosporales bacterium]|jgi:hypothetical protein|nr:hypothetical protein [Holosporales bacterium]
MEVGNQDCEWAELKEQCPIDSRSESFLVAGPVSISHFAWACMVVYEEKWVSPLQESIHSIESFVDMFSYKDAEDRTMSLPEDLIEKHEAIRKTLISANDNGEF